MIIHVGPTPNQMRSSFKILSDRSRLRVCHGIVYNFNVGISNGKFLVYEERFFCSPFTVPGGDDSWLTFSNDTQSE